MQWHQIYHILIDKIQKVHDWRMGIKMKFKNIPQSTKIGNYQVVVDWADLLGHINRYIKKEDSNAALDLNPDFQRGHVWTKEQQVKYVERKLTGGISNDIIYFNCTGWMSNFKGPFVIVDGLQRLTAATKFLTNEIKVYNKYYKEFTDRIPSEIQFMFNINNLKTRKEVLTWYIEMNSNGVIHTDDEIKRVQLLLEKED